MQILSHKRCVIGEGPIWNKWNQKLYHVDGVNHQIHEIDLETRELTVRELPFPVAAIGFSQTGQMLVSCWDGAYILHEDNSRTPLHPGYEIRYGNDAKVGPDGRFYIGTQSSKYSGNGSETDGKLYSIHKDGSVRCLLDGLLLSNGMEWSMDEKFFYHTDSATKIIKEYSFEKETGNIAFTGRQIELPGVDGFTVGDDNCLYVAQWGCGCVAVVDTKTMEIRTTIPVPTKAPASCCFAGDGMDRLIVVTATYGLDAEVDVYAGCTFISQPGVKGRTPYLFG